MAKTMAQLEAHAHKGIEICRQLGRKPRDYVRMRRELGTIGADKKLVRSGDLQSGLQYLVSHGKREWTVEGRVVEFGEPFYDADDIKCAKWRLKEVTKNLSQTDPEQRSSSDLLSACQEAWRC